MASVHSSSQSSGAKPGWLDPTWPDSSNQPTTITSLAAASKGNKSHIRVAVRVRPPVRKHWSGAPPSSIVADPANRQISVPPTSDRAQRVFVFDEVHDVAASQVDLYRSVATPMVDQFLEGFNVTIMAYGQTGSGKTHTMGSADQKGDEEGITQQVMAALFDAQDSQRGQAEYEFRVQFLEIHNEALRDLLNPAKEGRGISLLEVNGSIHISGARQELALTHKSMMKMFQKGCENRAIGSTQQNNRSSRSHAIFTLIMYKRLKADPATTYMAKLHLVDLAGSERNKKSGTTGTRFREGVNINHGLLALGKVINALARPSKSGAFIPYRDSKLTRLLQDSLGGNSHTVLVACVSAEPSELDETLSTLKYASDARNVRMHPQLLKRMSSFEEGNKVEGQVWTLLEAAAAGGPNKRNAAVNLLRRLDEETIWQMLVAARQQSSTVALLAPPPVETFAAPLADVAGERDQADIGETGDLETPVAAALSPPSGGISSPPGSTGLISGPVDVHRLLMELDAHRDAVTSTLHSIHQHNMQNKFPPDLLDRLSMLAMTPSTPPLSPPTLNPHGSPGRAPAPYSSPSRASYSSPTRVSYASPPRSQIIPSLLRAHFDAAAKPVLVDAETQTTPKREAAATPLPDTSDNVTDQLRSKSNSPAADVSSRNSASAGQPANRTSAPTSAPTSPPPAPLRATASVGTSPSTLTYLLDPAPLTAHDSATQTQTQTQTTPSDDPTPAPPAASPHTPRTSPSTPPASSPANPPIINPFAPLSPDTPGVSTPTSFNSSGPSSVFLLSPDRVASLQDMALSPPRTSLIETKPNPASPPPRKASLLTSNASPPPPPNSPAPAMMDACVQTPHSFLATPGGLPWPIPDPVDDTMYVATSSGMVRSSVCSNNPQEVIPGGPLLTISLNPNSCGVVLDGLPAGDEGGVSLSSVDAHVLNNSISNMQQLLSQLSDQIRTIETQQSGVVGPKREVMEVLGDAQKLDGGDGSGGVAENEVGRISDSRWVFCGSGVKPLAAASGLDHEGEKVEEDERAAAMKVLSDGRVESWRQQQAAETTSSHHSSPDLQKPQRTTLAPEPSEQDGQQGLIAVSPANSGPHQHMVEQYKQSAEQYKQSAELYRPQLTGAATAAVDAADAAMDKEVDVESPKAVSLQEVVEVVQEVQVVAAPAVIKSAQRMYLQETETIVVYATPIPPTPRVNISEIHTATTSSTPSTPASHSPDAVTSTSAGHPTSDQWSDVILDHKNSQRNSQHSDRNSDRKSDRSHQLSPGLRKQHQVPPTPAPSGSSGPSTHDQDLDPSRAQYTLQDPDQQQKLQRQIDEYQKRVLEQRRDGQQVSDDKADKMDAVSSTEIVPLVSARMAERRRRRREARPRTTISNDQVIYSNSTITTTSTTSKGHQAQPAQAAPTAHVANATNAANAGSTSHANAHANANANANVNAPNRFPSPTPSSVPGMSSSSNVQPTNRHLQHPTSRHQPHLAAVQLLQLQMRATQSGSSCSTDDGRDAAKQAAVTNTRSPLRQTQLSEEQDVWRQPPKHSDDQTKVEISPEPDQLEAAEKLVLGGGGVDKPPSGGRLYRTISRANTPPRPDASPPKTAQQQISFVKVHPDSYVPPRPIRVPPRRGSSGRSRLFGVCCRHPSTLSSSSSDYSAPP